MNPFFFAGQFSHPPIPFFPTQIPNLALWFDASNSSSIITNTGTSNPILQWNDLSPNKWNVSGVSGVGPYYNPTGFNGNYPTIIFSGISDYLVNSNVNITQSSTWIFIGYSYSGALISGGDYLAFGGNNANVNLTQELGIIKNIVNYNPLLFAGTVLSLTVNNVFSPFCMVGIFNNNNSIINFNGMNLITGQGGSQNIAGLTIGNGIQQSSEGWNGPISEIIAYSGILTTGQISQIHQYAQSKWGTP